MLRAMSLSHLLPPHDGPRDIRSGRMRVASPTGASCPVLLDVTRSLSRLSLPRPTGIDRVEAAYLDWAVTRPGGAWLVAGVGGRQWLVPPEKAQALARYLARLGTERRAFGPLDLAGRLAPWRCPLTRRAEAAVRTLAATGAPDGSRALVDRLGACLPAGASAINVGHVNLTPAGQEALAAARLRCIVMIHDLIPLDHPEFSRPAPATRFRTRLDAALGAETLLCNSQATADALAAAEPRVAARCLALPLGVTTTATVAPGPEGVPRFTVLGTIEGRKNHALLLSLWRRLSAMPDPPHLHVVGRRGWAAASVFETLDRAPFMGRTVFEHADLDDAAVARLIAGSRALLFPSFAEGFGLPLAEALAMGVPAIAADLPALREVGGLVPDYLDPLDGLGWLDAITDYASSASTRRAAQIERLAHWRAPRWAAHFARLESVLAEPVAALAA